MSDPIQNLLGRLNGAKPAGEGRWIAFCPAHEGNGDGHRRSLSIRRGEDGKALVYCHAGCELGSIVGALGMLTTDLFADTARPEGERRIVATYRYTDERGELLFEVVRFEPKDFRQRRPDGAGGWTWHLDDTRRVLYRLPELLAADPGERVFVCEGEKDCDNLAKLGLVATCNPCGAGKWKSEYSDTLKGRRVAIVPDADEPGRRHAEAVARSLNGTAADLKILDLAAAFEGFTGKDSTDFIDWRDSQSPDELRAALLAAADAAPPYSADAVPTAPAEDRPRAALRRADSIIIRLILWLWLGRIPAGKLTLLIGNPGGGKSLLTADMGARVSRGFMWPDGASCEAGGVIMLSGEDDPADTTVPRLAAAGADLARVSILDGIHTKDPRTGEARLDLPQLDRHLPAIREAIRETGARLLVIDPISSFVGAVDDHRNAELRGLLSALAALAAETGCAVVCVSHLRKSGGLAVHQCVGSLAYTAAARAVWALVRDPEDEERRLFLPVKMNLARDTAGLAFRVDANPEGVPVATWEPGAVELRADDVLNPDLHPGRPPVEREEAAAWLCAKLANGPRLATELLSEARAEGITDATLKRAKADAGAKADKVGFQGAWAWYLPGREAKEAQSPTRTY